MTVAFLVLCVAVVAFVPVVVSTFVGAAVIAGERWLTRVTPAAQSRILMGAALAPAFVGLIVLGGWAADLALFGCRAHRCLHDHATAWPSLPVFILAGAVVSRVAIAAGSTAANVRRARSMCRLLESLSSNECPAFRVLARDEPEAFVMGVLRPRVYVSRGMLAAAGGNDLKPVLAHEQAHAERRDPLRRLIASVGLAFHLPGIASILERRLARAQEMAADEAAAHVVGDPSRVAELLIRLARLQSARSAAAVAWLGSDLEARVRDLLHTGRRPDYPSAALLLGAAAAAVILGLLGAHQIHSDAEFLLKVLGR